MSKDSNYWRRWIREIAAQTSKDDIAEHIQRHATEDLLRDLKTGSKDDWIASMYNLLAIFQLVHFEDLRTHEQFAPHMIRLLKRKWEESPKTTVPPPLDPRSW